VGPVRIDFHEDVDHQQEFTFGHCDVAQAPRHDGRSWGAEPHRKLGHAQVFFCDLQPTRDERADWQAIHQAYLACLRADCLASFLLSGSDQCSASSEPQPWILSWMPYWRSAYQYVAVLMAITGLSSQNSAIAATSAIARLVPTCTMASTLPRFTRLTASRSSVFDTRAIAVGLLHLKPSRFTTLAPHSPKKPTICLMPTGISGLVT